MHLDDMINDNTLNQNYSIKCDEFLELKQALLSKKKYKDVTAFSIEREYINSPEFHAKFEKLPVNKNVQESLYKESGRLLEFINNLEPEKQSQERLLAIDAKTGKFIVDNFNRDGETYGTGFDEKEHQKMENCLNPVILIHNHSLNGPPSGQDLLTCLHNDKIAMSVIVCHNGDIYSVSDVRPEFETNYNKELEYYRLKTSNENDAKRLTMTRMYQENEKLSDKHKMFIVKKL